MRGVFITFEGCDGSGKSTQIRALESNLRERGLDPIITREPGGTTFGEVIRNILLDKNGPDRTALSELFLYASSRSELVAKVIKPALEGGRIVISERFSDSSLVYQGFAGGVSIKYIETINAIATSGIVPDLTFVLDIEDENLFRQRVGSRQKDKIESRSWQYHSKVRQGYRKLTDLFPERIKIIDASQPVQRVQTSVWSSVEQLLVRRGVLS